MSGPDIVSYVSGICLGAVCGVMTHSILAGVLAGIVIAVCMLAVVRADD